MNEKFLSYEGRITRSTYFLSNFLLIIISSIIFNIFIYVLPIISLAWLCIDFMIWSCLIVKRCHDMDLSGWYGLIALIPIAHLYFILKDGTIGPNKYGEDPKCRTYNNKIIHTTFIPTIAICSNCNKYFGFVNDNDEIYTSCPHCNTIGKINKTNEKNILVNM